MIERVHSPNDPRLDDFRDLKGEGDRIATRGVFIAEGKLVVAALVTRAPQAVRSLLIAEPRLDGMAEVLEGLPAAVPVLVADQAAMDAVVGFRIHRGVLASGVRPQALPLQGLIDAGAETVVVLEGLVNHDNVGGIFRSAAGLGASAVLLDSVTADPLYRKAIRVSIGASLFVPYTRTDDLGAALATLAGAGFTLCGLTPSSDAVDLGTLDTAPARVALIVGTEGAGLNPTTLEACQLRLRIPMAGGVDSLNVATAAAIALFELSAIKRRAASGRRSR